MIEQLEFHLPAPTACIAQLLDPDPAPEQLQSPSRPKAPYFVYILTPYLRYTGPKPRRQTTTEEPLRNLLDHVHAPPWLEDEPLEEDSEDDEP